jgi:very-short-patch-repair endonuclease
VYHFDLFGKREIKYDFLFENSIKTIEYRELPLVAPDYFFVVKDFGVKSIYDKGFAVTDLFKINSLGIQTHRDSLSIDSSKINLSNRISDFYNLTIENTDILKKYDINENSEWQLKDKRIGIFSADKIVPIGYRPFDNQFIYNDKNIVDRLRDAVSKHIIGKANICLVVSRQCVSEWRYIFLSKFIIESNLTGTAGRFGSGNFFPLYLYPTIDIQQTINQTAERTPNLNMEIVNQIAEKLGMQFVNEKLSSDKIQTPLNLPKGETSSIDSSESLALSPSSGGVGEVGCSTVLKGMTKPGYITANPTTYNLIKVMRDTLKNNPTDAENIMWEYLKTKKTGFKIRRQHIIDDFITDFVCLSKKVVIEIDGKIHLKQKEYDELRTIRLNQLGYEVIRFTNEEVFANPAIIALRIKEILENKDDLQDEDKSDSSVLDDLVDGLNSSPFEDVGKSLNSPPMEGLGEVFAPIDILDYIYAVLHSPTYREKYKEFLKIDFPRVPYPKDKDTFWQLVKLGGEIRQIHLLESPTVEKFITQYPIDGNNVVGKTKYQDGNVFINDTQYFENVSETAWNFYIGGYQPAQKWLKDRKDRILEFEDILHYQKIVVALTETDRLMKEIDEIEIE